MKVYCDTSNTITNSKCRLKMNANNNISKYRNTNKYIDKRKYIKRKITTQPPLKTKSNIEQSKSKRGRKRKNLINSNNMNNIDSSITSNIINIFLLK